ncbi:hypothetical protein GCM10020295_82380 [Streptomyces cinereospinus]
MTGGEALARTLDHAASGSIPPVTTSLGLTIRLRYLTWGSRGDHWLRAAGISVTGRTINRWTSGVQRPRPDNLRLIDRAFWLCRRASLADHYKQRLWDDGRSRRIEIHPVDQKSVPSSPAARVARAAHQRPPRVAGGRGRLEQQRPQHAG